MKITVVTVAYNEERTIKKTIESVLGQSSDAIEYIICDGKSQDKTVEIANSYRENFIEKEITYTVNSEKDLGIYDAMNKGVKMAEGDYICFLNAGDFFCEKNVIESVINAIEQNQFPDIVYGNIVNVDRNVITYGYGDDRYLFSDMSVPHPATFTKTSLLKENLFDTKYKIAADYNFVLGQKISGKKFFHIDKFITYFSFEGVSNNNLLEAMKECEAIKNSYGLKTSDTMRVRYRYIKRFVTQKIKKFLPQKLWELWCVKIKQKELYIK